jgi:hypothetical protein
MNIQNIKLVQSIFNAAVNQTKALQVESLTMVYDTQNYWVSGLCLSFEILKQAYRFTTPDLFANGV